MVNKISRKNDRKKSMKIICKSSYRRSTNFDDRNENENICNDEDFTLLTSKDLDVKSETDSEEICCVCGEFG